MLTSVDLAAVDHLADVGPILEKMGASADAVSPPSPGSAAGEGPGLRDNVAAREFLGQGSDRAAFGADCLGVLGHDDELLADARAAAPPWRRQPGRYPPSR
jgi:hypothetical protein